MHVYVLAVTTGILGLLMYFIQISVGTSVVWASAVFQPFITFESIIFILALLSMGISWSYRGAKNRKVVALIGENSFGIYLSHALIIYKISNYFQPHSSEWYVILPSLVIGLPLVYGLAFLLSEFLRRTPISVILTGRRTIFKTTRLYKAIKSIKCLR